MISQEPAAHPLSDTYRFIVFGLVRFSGLPQRELAFARGLAERRFRVDFIEGMPSLAAKTRDGISRLMQPLRDEGVHGVRDVPDHLFVHVPPTVPTFFRSSWTPSLDRLLFRRWFKRVLADVDWEHTILLVTMPYWWKWFVDRDDCPARVIMYDRCDALEASARNARTVKRFKTSERLLAREVDLVTCSASTMVVELGEVFTRHRIHLLPNAVHSSWTDHAPPGAAERNRGDVAYLGATDEPRFDQRLLQMMSAALPDHRFHIIGPAGAGLKQRMAELPSIVLHGALAPDAAGEILRRSAVGIIPYRKNHVSDLTNPLKMYEYAACGLPIVAMRTAELEAYQHVVTLVENRDAFINEVKRAAGSLSDEGILRQHAFAKNNTWDHRVDALLYAVTELLEG